MNPSGTLFLVWDHNLNNLESSLYRETLIRTFAFLEQCFLWRLFLWHTILFSLYRLWNRFALYFIVLESLSHKNALFQDWASGSRVEVKTMKSLQTTDKRWSVTFGSGELKFNSCHTDYQIRLTHIPIYMYTETWIYTNILKNKF